MSKQTAVEYLIQYMMNNQYFVGNDLADVFERAKAMEREQMVNEITEEQINKQAYLIDNALQRMFFRSGIEWCRNMMKIKQHETNKGGEQ